MGKDNQDTKDLKWILGEGDTDVIPAAQKLANKLNIAFHELIVDEGKHYELYARCLGDGVKVTPYYDDNLLLSLNITGSIYVEIIEGGFRVTPTRDDHPMTVIRDEVGVVLSVGSRRLGDFEITLENMKALRKFCVAFFKDCQYESKRAEQHPEGHSEMVPLEEWGKGKMQKVFVKTMVKDEEPETSETETTA